MYEYSSDMIDEFEKRSFFALPMKNAIVVFSVVFFAAIAALGGFAYYFTKNRALEREVSAELNKVMEAKQVELMNILDKEVEITKIFSSSPFIKSYFLDPQNDSTKQSAFNALKRYADFTTDKKLSWLSTADGKHYVNGEYKATADYSNPDHLWIKRALETKSPPHIEVGYDSFDRMIYNLYIDFPIYADTNAANSAGDSVVGFICNQISFSTFIERLNLPSNVFIFYKDGFAIGAADSNLVIGRKTVNDVFGTDGEQIFQKAKASDKNSSELLNLGENFYAVSGIDKFNLFFVARGDHPNGASTNKVTILFVTLIFILLLIFAVFNVFIFRILKAVKGIINMNLKASLTDDLTKLPNRRFFNIRFENEWNRSIRGKTPISFLMMDLDHFKDYNDTHGHFEGDLLLQRTAAILLGQVTRSSDFVARIGGEEFCIILPNTNIFGAQRLAESIRIAMENTEIATISIGVASIVPTTGDNSRDLVNKADNNLYKAKNTGRNRVAF